MGGNSLYEMVKEDKNIGARSLIVLSNESDKDKISIFDTKTYRSIDVDFFIKNNRDHACNVLFANELEDNKILIAISNTNKSLYGYKKHFSFYWLNFDKGTIKKVDKAVSLGNGLYSFRKNHKSGIVDIKGNVLVKPEYASIRLIEHGKIVFSSGKKCDVVDPNFNFIFNSSHASIVGHITTFSMDIYKIKKGDKFGLISSDGKLLLDPIYEDITVISEDRVLVHKENIYSSKGNKTVIFDISKKKNVLTLDGSYFYLDVLDDLFVLSDVDNHKTGVVKASNNDIVVPFMFDGIQFLNDKRAIVKTRDKKSVLTYGIVDLTKKDSMVVELGKYRDISKLNDNRAVVTYGSSLNEKKFGIIDTISGDLINELAYDYVKYIGNNRAIVALLSTSINDEKETFNSAIFDLESKKFIFPFTKNMFYSRNRGGKIIFKDSTSKNFGLMDSDGNIVVKPLYYNIDILNDNFLSFSDNRNKYGIMDNNENIIVEPKYDEITNYLKQYNDNVKTDFFMVRVNHNYGIVNSKGEVIIEPEYKDISLFNNGMELRKGEVYYFPSYSLTDMNGKFIIRDCRNRPEKLLSSNRVLVEDMDSGLYGVIDLDGKEILDAKYRNIQNILFKGRKAYVLSKDEKHYEIADLNGKTLIDLGLEKFIESDFGIVFSSKKGRLSNSDNNERKLFLGRDSKSVISFYNGDYNITDILISIASIGNSDDKQKGFRKSKSKDVER